ncbi:MAG TPA: YCF48-related protein [Candidatus Acidoferrum sp.]|jgi:hypothetical protein
MASDDRDRNFEKTLARHLRAQNPSADSATSPDCPDAETLAAYHERLLSPEEMIFWKRHLPGCQRCVQILAELEATDDLPVDILDEKNLHVVPAVAAPAAPQAASGSAPKAVPQSNVQSKPQEIRRQPRFHPSRWVLPAAALAAGLFVYIALHNKPSAKSTTAPVEIAENRPPSPPPAPTSSSEQSQPKVSAPDATRSAAPPQKSSRPPAANDSISRATNEKRRDTQAAAGLATHDFSADSSATARKQLDGTAATGQKDQFARDRINSPASDLVSAPSLKKEQEDKSKHASSLALAQPQALPKSPRDTTETVEVTAESAGVAKASPAPPQNLVVNGAMGGTILANVASSNTSLVAAPGGIILWRAGPAGILERSTDSGATWKIQSSGVITNLLAGSAPSEKTCWIVGAAGSILLTTDGGDHWQKIQPPIVADFNSVFAVDSRQATITSAPQRQSYKTTDGGRTWKLIANP